MVHEKDVAAENREFLATSLALLMEQTGKSRTDVCKDLDIKYTTFSDWINAKTYPRIDKIDALAKYFGVKKSVLTGWKSQEEINEDVQDNVSILTLQYSDCTDAVLREKIKAIIDTLNLLMNKLRELDASNKFGKDYEILNDLYWLQRHSAKIVQSVNEVTTYVHEKSVKMRLEKSRKTSNQSDVGQN